MVRSASIGFVLAALCFGAPALAQQDGVVSEQAAREAVDAVRTQFLDAYNAGKAADVAAVFAESGEWLTPSAKMTNRQEIEKAVAGRIKAGWTKETATILNVHPAGPDIWATGEYSIEGTGPNSGKRIGGYYAEVLTHEGSGWRVRMLIGNFKPALDVTGMAAAMSK